ncbi:phage tail tape measure protein [Desulfurobacterium thermolithotrophum]|uniref:phage tail tape measure protein n=1 Tax=Desulfurobacterium thermolithotrophum TaxID=64160 RepID=UPI0013CF77FF|nr:phage tail tape measure protein [Desulfurobacterium thermolithotrophum]
MERREFALQLIVGVKDLFSQKVNRIEALSEKLQKRLQTLDGRLKNVEAFGKLSKEISELSQAEQKQIEKIKALESTYEKFNQELKTVKAQYESKGRSSKELDEKLKTLRAEIEKVSSSLTEEKRKLEAIKSEKEKAVNESKKLSEALKKEGLEIGNLYELYDRLPEKTQRQINSYGTLIHTLFKLAKAEFEHKKAVALLEREQKNLQDELKKVEKELKRSGEGNVYLSAKAKELREKLEKVSSSLREEKEKLEKVNREKEEATKRAETLRKALQSQGFTLKDITKDLEKYQKELEETAKKQEELEKKLSSSSLMTVGARLKRMAALGGIGASASFAIKDIVNKMVDFDRQAHLIVARTELTTKDLDRVKKDLIDIYRIIGKAPEEIAEVYAQIHQLTGLQGEELKKAVIQALKVQKVIPEWDTKEITRAIAQMRKAFGITAEEATDLMTTVFTKAGDKANDLLDTLWEYAPLMKEAGLSAKEFVAYLIAGANEGAFNFDKLADTVKESFKARLTDISIWQALVGEGEKAGIVDQLLPVDKFGHEARKIKQYLAEIREGFETGNDRKKKEGYSKLLQHLAVLYKKDVQAARNIMEQIFGIQGTEDITHKVLAKMGEAIADPDRILGKWKGATDQMFQESKTFFNRLNDAWRRVEAVFLKSFDDLDKDLKPVGDVILQIANAIGSFAEKHPLITKFTLAFLGFMAVLGSLGAVLQFIAMASSFAFGGWISSFRAISVVARGASSALGAFSLALRGLGAAFSSLTFSTLVWVAVIGVVVSALYVLYRNWDKVWGFVKSTFSSAVEFVKAGFSSLRNLLSKGLKFYLDYSPIGLFVKAVKSAIDFVSKIDLTESGKKIIETLTAGILSVIKKPLEAVNWLKDKISGVFGFFFGDEKREEEKKKKLREKGVVPPERAREAFEKATHKEVVYEKLHIRELHQKKETRETLREREEIRQKEIHQNQKEIHQQEKRTIHEKVLEKQFSQKEKMEKLTEKIEKVKEQGNKTVSFSPKVNVNLSVSLQGVSEQNFKEKLLEAIDKATPELKWAFEKLMKDLWEDNTGYAH